jgi:hypothetical protein
MTNAQIRRQLIEARLAQMPPLSEEEAYMVFSPDIEDNTCRLDYIAQMNERAYDRATIDIYADRLLSNYRL